MSNKMETQTNSAGKGISSPGFTLVELLVAMVISLVVMTAIYSTYASQQRSYIVQEQVGAMQQNLRGAIYFMAREARMAGYDPTVAGGFGVTDIRYRDTDNNLDVNGNSSVAFTADFDEDSVLDGNETISYSLYDYPVASPDGKVDLARNSGGGRQLLAENIEALGFAYAFDNDADGQLDTSGGNVIWAIDSDNDNDLDLDLDTNGDGVIDASDDTNPTNGLIDGTPLATDVPLTAIRAVKIWILARTDRTIRGYTDTNTYVVGDKVVTPSGNARKYRRRLLKTTVKCRNL